MILPPKFGLALLLVAIALPLLEIALLIKVAGEIGGVLTLLIVIGTAVLGMWVLQGHGFIVMRRMNDTLSKGGTPLQPMIEGGLLFLAGWLLISPGLICDGIGLALLVPATRHLVASSIKNSLWPGLDDEPARKPPRQADSSRPFEPRSQGQPRTDADGPIIEGEWERIEERDVPTGRPDNDQRRG